MSEKRGAHFEGTAPEDAVQEATKQLEKRVALVIGNGAYEHASHLPNPINDARSMAAKLTEVGFDVIEGVDLTYGSMAEQVRDFGRHAREAATTLLFYAGHGIQVDGRNFLVPIDAALEFESDVSLELIELQALLNQMAAPDRTSLVFLDACRNNPLAKNLARATGMRSADVESGLAATARTAGTFIAYATEPNHIAYDGDGAHGYFTEELLSRLETPGLEVTGLLRQVRVAVEERTKDKNRGAQIPWHQEALRGDFYFVPAVFSKNKLQQELETQPPQVAPSQDYAFWKSEWEDQRKGTDLAALQAIIYHAPPYFSSKARVRIEEIELESERQKRLVKKDSKGKRERIITAQGDQPEGHIKIDTPIIYGASDGWFQPGNGKKEWFQDSELGPEMVVIPPGKFIRTNQDPLTDECLYHEVTIDYPYAVGRYAITFAQWDAFVSLTGSYLPKDKGWGRGKRPVINVSWYDVQVYIQWLNQITGKTYRLLSEAEWEYACRAGTTSSFWYGDKISTSEANYNGYAYSKYNYGIGRGGKYREKTVPVDSFTPNTFGLYQMHGNIWEWCADPWHENFDGAPSDGSVWTESGYYTFRVLRGGSWYGKAEDLCSIVRTRNSNDDRGDNIGFRLARTLTP